jgi:hypothetical protein
MAVNDIIVVSCVVALFASFAGVLAFVSWDSGERK